MSESESLKRQLYCREWHRHPLSKPYGLYCAWTAHVRAPGCAHAAKKLNKSKRPCPRPPAAAPKNLSPKSQQFPYCSTKMGRVLMDRTGLANTLRGKGYVNGKREQRECFTCCHQHLATLSPTPRGSAHGEEDRERSNAFFRDAGRGRPAVPLKAREGRTGRSPGSPLFEPVRRYC